MAEIIAQCSNGYGAIYNEYAGEIDDPKEVLENAKRAKLNCEGFDPGKPCFKECKVEKLISRLEKVI